MRGGKSEQRQKFNVIYVLLKCLFVTIFIFDNTNLNSITDRVFLNQLY